MDHTNENTSGLARSARIIQFLWKYRRVGAFSGLDLDDVDPNAPEGAPEEFVSDLEVLGPTFIKIGQVLSTRADMVPPPYLAALEKMQDEVSPILFDEVWQL